jgi:hypothetical protein
MASGRHFIAEHVKATSASTAFGRFRSAVAFIFSGHDNDRFDPVEAPQQRMGAQGFRPGAFYRFRLDRA